jgi:nitrite reductase/ring-hydroxylating ferredoxin subunit
MDRKIVWHKVLENKNELANNRVMTVNAGHKQIALSHFEGKICALDNRCPHQGGPLGEGSIENGILRCPWHGWDYHPCSGKVPGYDDGVESYKVEERNDEFMLAFWKRSHTKQPFPILWPRRWLTGVLTPFLEWWDIPTSDWPMPCGDNKTRAN